MPTNNFALTDAAIQGPYTRAVTITANDSTDLAEIPRAVNVHKSGASSVVLKVTLADDTTAVTMNLETGYVTPIRAKRIWATGTDATSIIALY